LYLGIRFASRQEARRIGADVERVSLRLPRLRLLDGRGAPRGPAADRKEGKKDMVTDAAHPWRPEITICGR
jgi:hypothetical protein